MIKRDGKDKNRTAQKRLEIVESYHDQRHETSLVNPALITTYKV